MKACHPGDRSLGVFNHSRTVFNISVLINIGWAGFLIKILDHCRLRRMNETLDVRFRVQKKTLMD